MPTGVGRNSASLSRLLLAVWLAVVVSPVVGAVLDKGSVDDKIALLIQRIDSYYRLAEEGDHTGAYEMLDAQDREGEKDKKEWVRASKKMFKGIRDIGWKVRRIWIDGDRVKVEMEIRLIFRRGEVSDVTMDYWLFEADNWYYIPVNLDDWDDDVAVEVPVPRTPSTVHIKTKN